MRISDWSSDVCSSDLPDRASSPYGEAAVKVARIAFAAMIAVTTPCALAQARDDARTGYWWYQAPPAPVEEQDDPDAVVKPVSPAMAELDTWTPPKIRQLIEPPRD